MATTPSGTRTCSMRRPLGRTHPSTTDPTGSGSAATVRRPAAMPSSLAGLRRRRSTTVGVTPAASAAATSSALARRTSSARCRSRSAAVSSATSLASARVVASTRAAACARAPSDSRVGDDMPSGYAGARPDWPGMTEALRGEVQRFVDQLTPAVEALGAGVPALRADKLSGDVALEAFDVVAAFVDADGLHTDNELFALLGAFGPLLDSSLARATPADVRRAGLVTGRRTWVERPSAFFEVLLAGDKRNGTRAAWNYYERAMALAHEVAATDVFVSHLELQQLERFRSVLLAALGGPEQARPAASGGEAPAAAKPAEAPPADLP